MLPSASRTPHSLHFPFTSPIAPHYSPLLVPPHLPDPLGSRGALSLLSSCLLPSLHRALMQSLALDTISILMAPPCAPPAQVPPNSRLLGPVPPRHLHWGRESNSNDQKQTMVFFPKMAPPLTIFPSWKQLYLFSCSGKTKQKTNKLTKPQNQTKPNKKP